MDNLQTQIDNLRTLQQSYDQLATAQASLAADVQAIKDAHILGFSYDGIIFEEGYEPQSAFGIISNCSRIIEIHDKHDTYVPGMSTTAYPEIEVFEMAAATDGTSYTGVTPQSLLHNWMQNSTTLKQVILPSLTGTNKSVMAFMRGMTNLRVLNILDLACDLGLSDDSYPSLGGDVNLIDIVYGHGVNGSRVLLRRWSPTNALLDNSTSLLTAEDIAAGFESNRQKLLYNIREHIVANLPDRIGLSPYTLTFSRNLRNAFDQATEDAFAAKNWDIAPARS